MSGPEVILLSESQAEDVAGLLGAGRKSRHDSDFLRTQNAQLGHSFFHLIHTHGSETLDTPHLTDSQFVEYCMDAMPQAREAQIEKHLSDCPLCREEVSRMKQLSGLWADEAQIARLERRITEALYLQQSQGPTSVADERQRGWNEAAARIRSAFLNPFAVFLGPLIRPQGAYGEAVEDETSTLEFVITQEGRVVEGLRGLLKRVNREYYVRIFALDPMSRTEFGDRKAMLSINDTYQDRPILHRKIDIGVTVLLGTDFRLTENSSLAVEMLPPMH